MKITVQGTFYVDNDIWVSTTDSDDIEWFTNTILPDTELILYSNEVGDEVSALNTFKYELFDDKDIKITNSVDQLKHLFEMESNLTRMFDSDTRVAMAMLEEIRKIKNKK